VVQRRSRKAIPSDILTHLWDADWEAMLLAQRGQRQIGDEIFTFDLDAAERACEFIETFCRHGKGDLAGQNYQLEPWQRWLIREIFGWKRADGTRQYRKAFLFVARKNAKSHLMAAILLYCLIADGEAGAEVYAAASAKDQVKNLIDPAKWCVTLDPHLAKMVTVYRNSISFPETGSAAYVVSSDAGGQHGQNSSAVLIDELHAHKNRDLFDVLATGSGFRRQPLFLITTTAGVYDREHVCYQEYRYAKQVAADPLLNPYYLPILFEASDSDDWRRPEVWHKANPGLAGGQMIKIDYLMGEAKEAERDPGKVNRFKQLHLNLWTAQATADMPMVEWHACVQPSPPFPLEGADCVLGLDLSLSVDLSACVEIYPYSIDPEPGQDPSASWGCWVEAHFWVCGENLFERESRDHAPYGEWSRRGWATIIDGPVIDDRLIEEHVRRLAATRKIRRIGFDKYAAAGIAKRLDNAGMPVEFVSQQFKEMSPAYQTLKRFVLSRQVGFRDHPLLHYCAGNVAVATDEHGNVKPIKKKSRGRIDGITAACNAIAIVLLDPIPKPKKTLAEMIAKHGGIFLNE
jgi:phage terminase large subunit-like protein